MRYNYSISLVAILLLPLYARNANSFISSEKTYVLYTNQFEEEQYNEFQEIIKIGSKEEKEKVEKFIQSNWVINDRTLMREFNYEYCITPIISNQGIKVLEVLITPLDPNSENNNFSYYKYSMVSNKPGYLLVLDNLGDLKVNKDKIEWFYNNSETGWVDADSQPDPDIDFEAWQFNPNTNLLENRNRWTDFFINYRDRLAAWDSEILDYSNGWIIPISPFNNLEIDQYSGNEWDNDDSIKKASAVKVRIPIEIIGNPNLELDIFVKTNITLNGFMYSDMLDSKNINGSVHAIGEVELEDWITFTINDTSFVPEPKHQLYPSDTSGDSSIIIDVNDTTGISEERLTVNKEIQYNHKDTDIINKQFGADKIDLHGQDDSKGVVEAIIGYSTNENIPSVKNSVDIAPDGNYIINVEEINGIAYKTVKIGDQIWMAENLKVTNYKNGDKIPTGLQDAEWKKTKKGAYCIYQNESKNGDIYGYLYNWYAVNDPRGLAPEGWHIPTQEEWQQLEKSLGMKDDNLEKEGWRGDKIGGKLKEIGTEHWQLPNQDANNSSGFNALPSGFRYGVNGRFLKLGFDTGFWSTASSGDKMAKYRMISFDSGEICNATGQKTRGLSVRCIKD